MLESLSTPLWPSCFQLLKSQIYHKSKGKPRGPSLLASSGKCSDQQLSNFTRLYFKSLKRDQIESDEIIIRSIPNCERFSAPKNPIVFCHGLSGFDKLLLIPSISQLTRILRNNISLNNVDLIDDDDDTYEPATKSLLEIEYWIGIKQALEAKGCTVLTAKVSSFGSIEERAHELNSFIEKETRKLRKSATAEEVYNSPDSNSRNLSEERIKVNLIAHSMGGLDCRYLISRIPNKNFEVASLTTVCTPHKGSEMADYVINLFKEIRKGLPIDSSVKLLPPAFYQLTTYYMKHFNDITPDDPNVSYFSYGACFKPKWFNVFYTSWRIIYNATHGEPNDGMVSVKSSKWGKYLGTLQNTDHLDIINWKNVLQQEMAIKLSGSSEEVQKKLEPKIDVVAFYLSIADNLAKQGF
ncbi:LAFE_0G02696g1_1 [Lachancea fermentati]|uniref:LAFE_0G02696g1_1 n=1 Tax=Lachancea fermentati TaxID=4955 RepID=A0A1G4MGY2_LACFM|nr:LAFE_0G02696g1_1 [Lachancea fermentati]